MPHTSEFLIPFAYKGATFRRPHHVSSELGGSPNGRSRPVKVLKLIFSQCRFYRGDGSDCDHRH